MYFVRKVTVPWPLSLFSLSVLARRTCQNDGAGGIKRAVT